MNTIPEFTNRGQISAARMNQIVRMLNAIGKLTGDEIIRVQRGEQGTTVGLSVEALLPRIPKSIGGGIWATVTGYDVQEDDSLLYSWEEIGGTETGFGAIDLYDGRLALTGQYIFLTVGSDGAYRFMWREPFLATMVECDTSTTAYVTDPTDGTRRVTVERVAGYYAVGDQVLLVPSYLVGSAGATRWTIADRIPMITYTPLDLSATTGDDGDTPAAVQDDPDIVGCEAPAE